MAPSPPARPPRHRRASGPVAGGPVSRSLRLGDEAHLRAAARDVPMNPVRARLAVRPQDSAQNCAGSNARAHLAGRNDGLATVAPLADRIGFRRLPRRRRGRPRWPERAARSGGRRPSPRPGRGHRDLERRLGRKLARGRPGPKPRPPLHSGRCGIRYRVPRTCNAAPGRWEETSASAASVRPAHHAG